MTRGAGCAAALLVAGCLPYATTSDPAPPLDVPDRFTSGGEGERRGSARWWVDLGDPSLETLITRALADSYDLRAGWARIRQAEALVGQSRAGRYPQIGASAGASYQRSNSGFFGATDTVGLNASVPVSYEIDLFDRIGATTRASELDALAAREEIQALAISLSAQVAEAWYDLVEARERRDLLRGQLETNETFLELVRLRFGQGLASAVDLHQQRQQVVATQAQLAAVDGLEAVLERRLSVLVGARPGDVPEIGARAPLPRVEDVARAGVPSTLLAERPDVRAARRRVEAADRRVGAAVAARFPTLRLTGAIGYSYSRTTGDTEQPVDTDMDGIPDATVSQPFTRTSHGPQLSAGVGLEVPLFDGGLRRSGREAADARLEEAYEAYGRTVLHAMLEVEIALAQERHEAARIERLVEQKGIADETLRATRDRYRQGLTDFLPVLAALQAHQQSELQLLAARRQILSHRIQLHRALGGTWTEDLEEPQPPEAPR